MSTAAVILRPSVLEARTQLADGRRRVAERHRAGSPGIQTAHALAELFERVVLGLFQSALDDLPAAERSRVEQDVALVAVAGFGRKDTAPYSDIDLMLLHARGAVKIVTPLAQRMVRDLFDCGLELGQSVRSIEQACTLAKEDVTICTTLMEHRLLAGSEAVYNEFAQRFAHQVRRGGRGLIKQIDECRAEERNQYGETVYLLEPNVKRSAGGLRDLQLLRWVAYARYGAANLDDLQRLSVILPDDFQKLLRAQEYLLHMRNELHITAGKAADQLTRDEQLRLAPSEGLEAERAAGLHPVERLMQEYFHRTDDVSHIVRRFVASARGTHWWEAWLRPLITLRLDEDFRLGSGKLWANARSLRHAQGDLAELLRLLGLANFHRAELDPAAVEAICKSATRMHLEVSPLVASRFMSLLSYPGTLGAQLRLMHDIRALEALIPDFARIRGLLQFNAYHKYTVDEHTFRAVEQVVSYTEDRGPLGHVYRSIKNKGLLHLALLVHDIGKGLPRDHSEVGAEIAQQIGERLYLSRGDIETLVFLVRRHLQMARLAFWRDIDDKRLVIDLAVEVESPERLMMLFVLTAADCSAVGPDVFNDWKRKLLTTLYGRVMHHLSGSGGEALDSYSARRREIMEQFQGDGEFDWYRTQVERLPPGYLEAVTAPQAAAELRQLRGLPPGNVLARGKYLPESGAIEYTIFAHESITAGVFHKLTGALTAHGLEILAAEIHTLANNQILDRFLVIDRDFNGEPPAERIAGVTAGLVDSLERPTDQPVFRRTWKSQRESDRIALLGGEPASVRIDNSTSDRFTIIDVFATDRTGLLFTISRTLFELGLSVGFAKIGTHKDRVVDVFYVTDQDGQKLYGADKLSKIHDTLLESIEQLANAPAQ